MEEQLLSGRVGLRTFLLPLLAQTIPGSFWSGKAISLMAPLLPPSAPTLGNGLTPLLRRSKVWVAANPTPSDIGIAFRWMKRR
jgi:hypothetical protein